MEPVVITGWGIVSPLGNTLDELTRRFAAGARVAAADGGYVAELPLTAVPPDKQQRLGRLDRLCRFLLAASYLAAEAAGLDVPPLHAERAGLSFGTGLGCLLTDEEYYRKIVEQGAAAASPRLFAYTVSSAAAGEVSIALGITGPNVTAHLGLAAGLGAIGYGADLIRLGKADVVLAGGADVIGPALIAALRDMRLWKPLDSATPFRDRVAGVYPAEGAAVAVLERAAHARARGARVWGRIEAYAAGFEPTWTRRTPQVTGVSATAARALAASGRAAVDVVIGSAHGTPVDDTERAALAAVLGARSPALVLAPKAALGDSFGASGVLGLALAAGLLAQRPAVADGVAWRIDGSRVDGAEATRALRGAAVVLVQALCYAGNIVSLVFARET